YLAGQNALKKKDLNAFLKTCTSDFVMTQMDGKKQNVSSMKEQFKSNFSADTKVETCVIKMLSCRIKGDTANASSLAHMKIKTKGPDGKPMVIESTDNAQDILVKTPQGWKFKASKSVDTKVSVNGKMVDPSKMAPPKKK
ncbi:MAG: nuclear transport factor 2 family protein, partial [Chthonomonadales bacterium]